MFDCHYDLLTHIYMKRNEIEYLKKYCQDVYNENNIKGGIFNLFYMTEKEMKDELNINKEEINIIENLKLVKEVIKENNLIPQNINYVFGIEGLDYLNNIEDIDTLYDLGVRSTNIVWNNQNKYGAGIRAPQNEGLTELGKQLVEYLIKKRIAIDLSHSNEKTFYDIIDVCKKMKKEGMNPIVWASHSNAKKLCNDDRNLTDDQIIQIKNLDGIIGLVTTKRFCRKIESIEDLKSDFKNDYISQIKYLKELLGGIENIAVATDDMKYYHIRPEYYQNTNIYPHNNVAYQMKNDLENAGYTMEEIEKILYNNCINKIINKIKM